MPALVLRAVFFFPTQEFGREHPQVPLFIKSLLYKQVNVASYQREFEVECIRAYPFAYGVLIFVLFHCYAIFMLLDVNFVYGLLCAPHPIIAESVSNVCEADSSMAVCCGSDGDRVAAS